MIQHILFPTDGSDAVRNALPYLIRFAGQFQAEVSLLHTYEFTLGHVMSRYGSDSALAHDMEERIAAHGEDVLAKLRQELEAEGLKVRGCFNEKGDAGQWIVRTAEREKCDLILMGTHGMSGLKSMFLGSTSHFVVNHSHKTPVFLIPVVE